MRQPKQPDPQVAGKDPALVGLRERAAAEVAHQRTGGSPRVYFEPVHGRNGHVDARGKFIPHEIPEGFLLDVDRWEREGGIGPAPLMDAEPVALIHALTEAPKALLVEMAEELGIEKPLSVNKPELAEMIADAQASSAALTELQPVAERLAAEHPVTTEEEKIDG
jgi:hypothetical protein